MNSLVCLHISFCAQTTSWDDTWCYGGLRFATRRCCHTPYISCLLHRLNRFSQSGGVPRHLLLGYRPTRPTPRSSACDVMGISSSATVCLTMGPWVMELRSIYPSNICVSFKFCKSTLNLWTIFLGNKCFQSFCRSQFPFLPLKHFHLFILSALPTMCHPTFFHFPFPHNLLSNTFPSYNQYPLSTYFSNFYLFPSILSSN